MEPPENKGRLRLCPECGSERIADAGPRYGKPPGHIFACPECGYEGASVTEGDEVTAAALREVEEEIEAWSRAQLKRLCPQCGSSDLADAFWRQTGWHYRCRKCEFVGQVFEGDEEMARALRERYEARERTESTSGP